VAPEQALKEAAERYNRRWDSRRAQAAAAMQIVLSCERRGIALDPRAYPGVSIIDIQAAWLRRFYDSNLAAGRYIGDPGDANGDPLTPTSLEKRAQLRRIAADELAERELLRPA
jgi:hypothetical protein